MQYFFILFILTACGIQIDNASSQTSTRSNLPTVGHCFERVKGSGLLYNEEGSGTAEDPYLLYTADQLFSLSQTGAPAFAHHYELCSNIDLGIFYSLGGSQFNIGGDLVTFAMGGIPAEDFFHGFFEGNNFTISNYRFVDELLDGGALFTALTLGGTIQNLNMNDVFVRTGGIAGGLLDLAAEGTITHCAISGHVETVGVSAFGDSFTGLLAAVADNVVITNSTTSGEVIGSGFAGGFIGLVTETMLGASTGITISYSSSSATVTSLIDGAGGFIGTLQGLDHLIERSFATGSVSAQNQAGGFIGYASADNSLIRTSFATGNVSGEAGIGGFVATIDGQTIIEDSYAWGNISAQNFGAGFAPFADGLAQIRRSYSSGNVEVAIDNGAGFIAIANSATVLIDNAWTTSSVFSPANSAYFVITDNTAGGLNNIYYASNSSCSGTCLTSGTALPTQNEFRFAYTPPMDGIWNFTAGTGIWQENIGGYPTHGTLGGSILGCAGCVPPPNAGPLVVACTFNQTTGCGLPTVSPTHFAEYGVGTLADPFLIVNAAQIESIPDNNPNILAKHFRIVADIDFTAYYFLGGTSNGIGSSTNPFTGSWDGGNCLLNGLTINQPTGSGVGFFNQISNATISRLRLVSSTIEGYAGVGSLAGLMQNSDIDNSSSICLNVRGYSGSSIGGLVGAATSTSPALIDRTFTHGEILTDPDYGENIGGLIGSLAINVSNSFSRVNISALSAGRTAGLVGQISSAMGNPVTISNSYATGDVESGFVGGFISTISGAANETVENSFATGNVLGGLLSSGYFSKDAIANNTNNYYFTGATCSGSCDINASGVATESDFFNPLNQPLNQWDFTTIWQAVPGDYPRLIE